MPFLVSNIVPNDVLVIGFLLFNLVVDSKHGGYEVILKQIYVVLLLPSPIFF